MLIPKKIITDKQLIVNHVTINQLKKLIQEQIVQFENDGTQKYHIHLISEKFGYKNRPRISNTIKYIFGESLYETLFGKFPKARRNRANRTTLEQLEKKLNIEVEK